MKGGAVAWSVWSVWGGYIFDNILMWISSFTHSISSHYITSQGKSYRSLPLKMDAVVSVAPRKDLITQEHICQMDVDVNECQVTISIQLQLDDSNATTASGVEGQSGGDTGQSTTYNALLMKAIANQQICQLSTAILPLHDLLPISLTFIYVCSLLVAYFSCCLIYRDQRYSLTMASCESMHKECFHEFFRRTNLRLARKFLFESF